MYFQLKRSIIGLENRYFGSKFYSFWPIWGVIFDNFGGQKSRFLDFFKAVLDLFGKCLGFVFGLKRPIFVLFSTRYWVSPLGSHEALVNVDKASLGLLVSITLMIITHNRGAKMGPAPHPSPHQNCTLTMIISWLFFVLERVPARAPRALGAHTPKRGPKDTRGPRGPEFHMLYMTRFARFDT